MPDAVDSWRAVATLRFDRLTKLSERRRKELATWLRGKATEIEDDVSIYDDRLRCRFLVSKEEV